MSVNLVAAPLPLAIENFTLEPLVINLRPLVKRMSDERFFEFCVANSDLRIERKANGEIVIMPPEGGSSGGRNSTINAELNLWSRQNSTGIAFTSSTGFRLPNGATYSPDAAWVRRSRLNELTQRDKERFPPLCPDFVIELRSITDRLRPLQLKMVEYMDNGARLGWLIDPSDRSVYVYRPDRPAEHLINVIALSGEPELPGFTLDLTLVWDPGF